MRRTRRPVYRFAPVYDDFSEGVRGDVAFYVREARRSSGEILELGCGTGRILIPIAQAGKRVTGIDMSPSMLKICRKKVAALPHEVRSRITLLRADMRNFSLNRRFGLIICPFRAFLHNLTTEDQMRTLGCVQRHLGPRGRFIMNNFDPWLDVLARHPSPKQAATGLMRTYTNSVTGNRVEVYENRHYDLTRQLVIMTMDFRELDSGGRVVARTRRPLKLRYIFRYEMEHLFELAGFEIEHLWGDFSRRDFKAGGEQIWVVRAARKR
jgi:SAM-dependent methyltransferase